MWVDHGGKVLHIERFQSTSLLDVLGKFSGFFRNTCLRVVVICSPVPTGSCRIQAGEAAGRSRGIGIFLSSGFLFQAARRAQKLTVRLDRLWAIATVHVEKKPGTLGCPALNLPGLFIRVLIMPLLLLRSCSAEREGRIRCSAGWRCIFLW